MMHGPINIHFSGTSGCLEKCI